MRSGSINRGCRCHPQNGPDVEPRRARVGSVGIRLPQASGCRLHGGAQDRRGSQLGDRGAEKALVTEAGLMELLCTSWEVPKETSCPSWQLSYYYIIILM